MHNERKFHREENVHDQKCRGRAREQRKREQRGSLGTEEWSLRRHILRLRVRKENTGNIIRIQRNIRYRKAKYSRRIKERTFFRICMRIKKNWAWQSPYIWTYRIINLKISFIRQQSISLLNNLVIFSLSLYFFRWEIPRKFSRTWIVFFLYSL